MLDKFNSTHPSIHVTAANIPFPTFDQTILTQMAGGEGPDVVRWDTPGFFQSAKAGLLTSLQDTITDNDYTFRAGPDAYTKVNGTRYGIVEGVTPYALLYNTALVKTAPANFNDFLADAKAATKDGVYGLGFRTTLPQAAGMWQDLCNYVFGYGGDWADGHQLTLNSPQVIQGVNAYKALYDAGVVPKGATATTYRAMLAAGKLAMEIDGGGIADSTPKVNPNIHLAAAAIPFPDKKVGEILSLDAINKASKHQDAALTFLKWLLTPDAQRMIMDSSSTGTSVATDITMTPDELAKKPLEAAYDQAAKDAEPQVVRGFEAQTNQISLIVVQQVIKALNGEDTKTAMDDAQTQATALVNGG